MNWHPESSKPVFFCAIGLIAAFLMPWVQIFGAGLSGYSLGQIGSYGNYAWVVPVLAGVTVLVTVAGANNRLVGAAAGAVPLLILLYWAARLGEQAGSRGLNNVFELAKHALAVGAWLTIGLCIAIIAFAVMKDVATSERSTSRSHAASGPFAAADMGLDEDGRSVIDRIKSNGGRIEVRDGGRFLALIKETGEEAYVLSPADVRKVAEANQWL